ncbi:MAG: glycerophosphodiester phosphodiesterase [Clostridia bacterium]|nr:glycerophosphodiester phosphodiesterase [Clostridia bacterium]
MIWLYVTVGIAAALLFLFILFLFLIKPRSPKKRPDTTPFEGKEYAHRGLHNKNVPENSLRAIADAVDRGLGIELDIQLSKDGQVVVFHDLTLNRMTGVDGKVIDYTAEELSKMSLNGHPDGIPTLKQVLEVVDGKIPLIIEMKIPGFDLSVCPKAFELLDEYQGPYCVESFQPFTLDWLRKNRPHVLRGQLSSDFFANKEKGNALQLFAVKNLLTNVFARPDFIAYDIRYPKTVAFRLCRDFWKALPIGWTIRSAEELNRAKNHFDAWICENIYD